jgi:hypothetical protein
MKVNLPGYRWKRSPYKDPLLDAAWEQGFKRGWARRRWWFEIWFCGGFVAGVVVALWCAAPWIVGRCAW